MKGKVTPEHLNRSAIVYVRQSTTGQVIHHTESQARQYALVDHARAMGFEPITVIDDDLGRSASGLDVRPGFQRLVASVCSGAIGAVFCLEASRLARNGRDWHHLIDLCALAGTLVIDPDGIYDPRLINDRLLLGLKGTMSEYELSLLRQRGLEARDAKARRGDLRFALPPGYCWDELGRIEIDPDERISEAIRLVFRKFRELGSVRQVFLWTRQAGVHLPVWRQSRVSPRIEWQPSAYHRVLQILQHPMYAGAYVFGRTTGRTRIVDGRAQRSSGHRKPQQAWSVLLKDHHPGYISWDEFEQNQTLIVENAHMKKRMCRKSARGGRALLTGLVRCGRCARMMRVFYGSQSGHAHRYQCLGVEGRVEGKPCIALGGVRVDRAVAAQILEAVSGEAVEAAIQAAERATQAKDDIRQVLRRELDQARYEADLAARRHELVDPAKRWVARELEARWNTALARVADLEERLIQWEATARSAVEVDREALLALARDLPAVWNCATTDARTKQRLAQTLIEEVLIDLDEAAHEAVITVHWKGGRHTDVRVARVRKGRFSDACPPSPVVVLRTLGGQWTDHELAMTLNRMACPSPDGRSWTTLRVRELRERSGVEPYDPARCRPQTLSVNETAQRLGICVRSVHRLIREGTLPARQLMPSAPWQVPVEALTSEAVRLGVQAIVERRPRQASILQDEKTLKLPVS